MPPRPLAPPGPGSHSGLRGSFTLDEKRQVIQFFAACKDIRATIAHFYPELPPEHYETRRKAILRWRRCAAQIERGCSTRAGAQRKKMRRPKCKRVLPPRPRGLGPVESAEAEAQREWQSDRELPLPTPANRQRRAKRTPNRGDVGVEAQHEDVRVRHPEDTAVGLGELISSAMEFLPNVESTRDGELNDTEKKDDEQGQDHQALSVATEESSEGERNQETEGRSSTAGNGGVVRRHAFTLDEKRRVLEYFARSNNMRETIAHFYPSLAPEEYETRRKAVFRWRKARDQILAGCKDEKASARKKMRPRGISGQSGVSQRPRTLQPKDAVNRLMTSANKAERAALRRKQKQKKAPTNSTLPLLQQAARPGQYELDKMVFSALGLPPTTQFPVHQSPQAGSAAVVQATAATEVSTVRPLACGETQFAIRRR